MDVVEDICTIDDLKRDPGRVIRQLNEAARPMLVTVEGEPQVIMLPARMFPSKKLALDAACELAAAAAV